MLKWRRHHQHVPVTNHDYKRADNVNIIGDKPKILSKTSTPELKMRREKPSKRDKEDSGVHLEDNFPSENKTSWDADLPEKRGYASTYVISGFRVSQTESMSQSDDTNKEKQLARSFQDKCRTTTTTSSHIPSVRSADNIRRQHQKYQQPLSNPHRDRTMVVQTKESLIAPRNVKSIQQGTHSHTTNISTKSKTQPLITTTREQRIQPDDTPVSIVTQQKGLKTSSSSKSMLERFRRLPVPKKDNPRSSLSPPITPESKSDSTAYATFSFGSDSETEESSASVSPYVGGGACAEESTTSTTVPSQETVTQPHRERKRDRNKLRFKKILRPIRRSHSAGCAKDVPAHALFLKHQGSEERGERRSVDTGRGSMERSDSESESELYNPEKQSSCTPAKPKKKSLAQEMKEKLAFLRRRHTDTSISGKEERPPPEVALDWSKGFDSLLTDRYGLELFRDFLRTEFSEENIEFWIACEEYKTIKTTNYSPLAQKIYSDYVAIQAPREVNLDSKTRLKTMENLDNPDKATFEIAQKRIQALMAKDSYPRFLQSSVYQDLLGEYKNRLKLKS